MERWFLWYLLCNDLLRSEESQDSLEGYLARLEGKHLVDVVCMDLATGYRALVRKHSPQARIVADGFHVIRTVNHHFLACWKQLDPVGSKNRGFHAKMKVLQRQAYGFRTFQNYRLRVKVMSS